MVSREPEDGAYRPLGPARREPEGSEPAADVWTPHPTNPDIEVNQRGRMRSRDFSPHAPQPPGSVP